MRLHDLIVQVIRDASRQRPADAVLHQTLRTASQLMAGDRRFVSEAVFAYYRWFGWLDANAPLERQVDDALAMDRAFRADPRALPGAELMARAVPEWVDAQVNATLAWVLALQRAPRLWIRARRGTGSALMDELPGAEVFAEGLLSDTLEYRGEEDLFRTLPFHMGAFEIQDLSSQLVGLLAAPRGGETWWDACAGEGGKLLHLAELMENRGLIWASDRAEWRLQKLKRRAARAKVFNYRAVAWKDPRHLPTRTRFDGVLVDAPCSGIGTWQRHPQARWTLEPNDVAELGVVQEDLLQKAASLVKPGGRLIYSVCTLSRRETEEVANAFEATSPDFESLALPVIQPFTQPGMTRVTFWPQDHGGNGMFVAAWRRRPSKPDQSSIK